MNNPLIIIGSGLGGYMLAKEWRKLDTQTPLVIITEDDGAFYSKPLLSTALNQQKTPDQLVIKDAEMMRQELTAEIFTETSVTAINSSEKTITFNAEVLGFSQLVFACGAEPIKPPLTGDAKDEVVQINNLRDYRSFRQWLTNKKQLAILGAGLVGCEFANDLLTAGYQVTLVAPDQYPLISVLPKEVGQLLQQYLSQQGAQWRLGVQSAAVNHHHSQVEIQLSDGQTCLADGVLSAIGLRPRIQLAKQSGILVNRGIIVNGWQQTNCSSIYALGDCAEMAGLVQMYVAALLQSARALAKILVGGHDPVHFPVMPIVVKTPALPLVFCPAPAIPGNWTIEGEGHHLQALFHDLKGQLRGFVLAGDKIRDKMPLAKKMALVLNE